MIANGTATLPGTYTFTARDHGKHTFLVTFETPGSQSVTATDTSTNSITGNATTTVEAKVAPTGVPVLAQGDAWLTVEKRPQQHMLESASALLQVTGLKETQLAMLLGLSGFWSPSCVATYAVR
jgi:hypothetical protein